MKTIKALILADKRTWTAEMLEELMGQVDCVLTLGDLSTVDIAPLLGNEVTVPRFGVYGNHCYEGYLRGPAITDLHLRRLSYGGITLGGFEGSLRYKEVGDFQYTQAEAMALLRDFGPTDIMVCHSPPEGIHDSHEAPHIGFGALRKYCERCRPTYLLHGHTHPLDAVPIPNEIGRGFMRKSMLGPTEVIYVLGHAILDLTIP